MRLWENVKLIPVRKYLEIIIFQSVSRNFLIKYPKMFIIAQKFSFVKYRLIKFNNFKDNIILFSLIIYHKTKNMYV